MKTLAMALLTLLLPAAALAQYQPAVVHVVAVLPPDIAGLTAAEFRVINLPPAEACLIEEQWDSPLTIGSIGWGFAIAFTEVQWGPLVHLGTLTFTAFEPIGPDLWIWVYPSNQSGNLLIVDENYEEIPTLGGLHMFNCTDWCDCQPPSEGARADRQQPEIVLWTSPDSEICWQDLPVYPTAAGETNWSAVKALY